MVDNFNVFFIIDVGVKRIGSVVVEFFEMWRGLDRELEVSLYFGGIEIIVIVWDILSGNIV